MRKPSSISQRHRTPGDVAKSINYFWTVLETPTSFEEVESACTGSHNHGNPWQRATKGMKGVIMIIMLDRYMIEIIDSGEIQQITLIHKDYTRYSWFVISREEARYEGFYIYIYIIYIGIFIYLVYTYNVVVAPIKLYLYNGALLAEGGGGVH